MTFPAAYVFATLDWVIRIQRRRREPAIPRGITYMNTIRKMPKLDQGAALEMARAQVGTKRMKMAPKIAPEIVASPPMTMPVSRVTDRNASKESGATKAIARALSAPATPV